MLLIQSSMRGRISRKNTTDLRKSLIGGDHGLPPPRLAGPLAAEMERSSGASDEYSSVAPPRRSVGGSGLGPLHLQPAPAPSEEPGGPPRAAGSGLARPVAVSPTRGSGVSGVSATSDAGGGNSARGLAAPPGSPTGRTAVGGPPRQASGISSSMSADTDTTFLGASGGNSSSSGAHGLAMPPGRTGMGGPPRHASGISADTDTTFVGASGGNSGSSSGHGLAVSPGRTHGGPPRESGASARGGRPGVQAGATATAPLQSVPEVNAVRAPGTSPSRRHHAEGSASVPLSSSTMAPPPQELPRASGSSSGRRHPEGGPPAPTKALPPPAQELPRGSGVSSGRRHQGGSSSPVPSPRQSPRR